MPTSTPKQPELEDKREDYSSMSYCLLIVHSSIHTHTSRSYRFLFLSDFASFVPTVATFLYFVSEYFFLVVVIMVVITSCMFFLTRASVRVNFGFY